MKTIPSMLTRNLRIQANYGPDLMAMDGRQMTPAACRHPWLPALGRSQSCRVSFSTKRVLNALRLITACALVAASPRASADSDGGNRVVISRFADRFYTQHDVRGAFAAFISPDYIQHNPNIPDGRDAAVDALAPMVARPGARFEVRQVLVDGDLALVQLLGRGDPATPGAAVADLYRLKSGRIVEHWDVIDPIAAGSDPLAGAAPSASRPAETRRNRVVMRHFVDLLFLQKHVAEAFTAYAAPDMLQHNSRLGQGRDGAIAALTPLFANPGAAFEVQHVLVDGDLAAVHYKGKLAAGDHGAAVVEIFRLHAGKIVEHWDMLQPIPTDARNPHPMF